MTSVTNTFRSDDLDYSSVPNSNEKQFSATANIQTKQDKILSQFEINLNKTMELLHNTSAPNNTFHDSEREKYDSSISHRYSRPDLAAQNQLEVENSELRSTIKSLKRENDSLKIDLSLKRNPSRVEEKERSFRASANENEELKTKIAYLQQENESYRHELTKVKTDYSQRFENLRQTNDEVISSFEEKHNHQLKNMKENYEREINELKLEIKKLESQRDREKEHFETEKRVYEKENAELMARINQVFALNDKTNKADENISTIMFEQMMREKHDLETRYHDLFNSYLSMLDHNKNLVNKLESREKVRIKSPERKMKSPERQNERSPIARPESSLGRIAKNRIKTLSAKKSRENTLERNHNLNKHAEKIPVEQITSFEDRLIPRKRQEFSPLRDALSPKYSHETEMLRTESVEKLNKKKRFSTQAKANKELDEEKEHGKKKKVILIEENKPKRSKSNPRKEKIKNLLTTTNIPTPKASSKTPTHSKTEKKRLI